MVPDLQERDAPIFHNATERRRKIVAALRINPTELGPLRASLIALVSNYLGPLQQATRP
jgi:hypothetical protein